MYCGDFSDLVCVWDRCGLIFPINLWFLFWWSYHWWLYKNNYSNNNSDDIIDGVLVDELKVEYKKNMEDAQ